MSLQRPSLNCASSCGRTRAQPGPSHTSSPGHAYTPPCHAHTPPCHTPPCHAHTPPCHAHTPPGHAYTPPGHAYIPPGHAHAPAGRTAYTSSSHAYSYPVLASDHASIAKAGLDPRACSVDSGMVLLWKDIDNADCMRCAPSRESLQGASIEEVMEEFVDAARTHKLHSDLRRHGSRDSITGPHKVTSPTPRRHHGSRDVLHGSRPVCESSQRLHAGWTDAARSRRPEALCRHTKDLQDKESSRDLSNSHLACLTSPLISEQDGHHRWTHKGSLVYGGSDGSKISSYGEHRTSSSSFSDDLDTPEEYPEVFDDVPHGKAVAMVNNTQSHWSSNCIHKTEAQCHNPECMKTFGVCDSSYKNCQFCHVVYCCWYCKKRDWKRHGKLACHGSRASKACREVIQICSVDQGVLEFTSRMARRGYLSGGRGCVMMGFPDLAAAQEFVRRGLAALEMKPLYVTTKEMEEASEVHGRVLGQLVDACSRYEPEVGFVLNVGVGVRWNRCGALAPGRGAPGGQRSSERSTGSSRSRSGSVGSDGGYGSLNCSMNHTADMEWHDGDVVHYDYSLASHRSPIMQRWANLKLGRVNWSRNNQHALGDSRENTRYGPTLILTGVPGAAGGRGGRRARGINFMNVQRKLRERGVTLRHQFPRVYAALVKYVSDGARFPAEIIYPVDTIHKRLFMCVLMPESEHELEWTQSGDLLSDLDISRQCLWESVPSPRFLSSPRRLCYPTEVSPTSLEHQRWQPHVNETSQMSAPQRWNITEVSPTSPGHSNAQSQHSDVRASNLSNEHGEHMIRPGIPSPHHVTVKSQPVTAKSQPVTAKSQPVTAKSQPVTAKSQTVTVKSQRETFKSQPVTAKSQPVTAKSQPVTAKSQPVTAKSQPETAKSQPVTAIVTPSTVTSSPVTLPAVSSSHTAVSATAAASTTTTSPSNDSSTKCGSSRHHQAHARQPYVKENPQTHQTHQTHQIHQVAEFTRRHSSANEVHHYPPRSRLGAHTRPQCEGSRETSGGCESPERGGPFPAVSHSPAGSVPEPPSQTNRLPWQPSHRSVNKIIQDWETVSPGRRKSKYNVEQSWDQTPNKRTKTGPMVSATGPLVSATGPLVSATGPLVKSTKQSVNSASKGLTVLSPHTPSSSPSLSSYATVTDDTCHFVDDTCRVIPMSSDW